MVADMAKSEYMWEDTGKAHGYREAWKTGAICTINLQSCSSEESIEMENKKAKQWTFSQDVV